LISTYSILIANLSQSDLPRWWKTYREKILKKRTKNDQSICPEGVDKDSGLTTRRKYKYSMEIAKTIIGIGIILWLIQESVTFFDYWKNPIDFFNDFFLIMMIADWIGIFTLLVFFVSQYMEKWSEFLSFLAQIGLYLYGLVAISGHVMFYYYIPVIVGVSSVMIIFLFVLHLVYKIKKRSQDGFLLQVQALVAVIVAIFDLFLGHAARYSILEEGLGEGIRLGLTFLPVQLEFVLTMAFAMYFLLKSSIAEKTRKTVLIVLNSIGLIGLMAGYMLWGDWYLPVKFAGSVVILLGVIFYLILSLKSLNSLNKMEEPHTSKC